MKDLCSGFPLEPNWTITCSESDDPRSSVLKNIINGISVFTVMVFSHLSKTTTRQMLNLCIPMMPYTTHVGPGVKSIIEMHRFNVCLVGVLHCLALV